MASSYRTSSSPSVAAYSLEFVIFAVCALIVVATATGLLIYGVLGENVRGSLTGLFLGSTVVVWVLCVVALWRRYYARARALDLPSGPGLFVVIHGAALAFVLAMSFLVLSESAEFQKAVDGVRLVYDAALVLFSGAYISFHFGLRRPIARSVYIGLAMAVVSVWRSFSV